MFPIQAGSAGVRVVAGLVRPSEYVTYNGVILGFGVRVMPSDQKGYLVQYRGGTRLRKLALGPHGVLTADQARSRAIQSLAEVKGGGDPAEVRKEGREAITVRELSERFDREHIAARVKESTAREYRRNLRRFILPALGRLRVTDVSRADDARFHHGLGHIPYQENRTLEIISKKFGLAEI
ncbi:MAG: integrase, partial [Sphingomonas bacterium]|nr:integrase [Sphingomonas bacterium]